MGEESLAHMIKRRRETLGFSQARLGELVGRSASTIRNWERGKSTPSAAADARALAAVLGLSEGKVVEAAGFEPSPAESHQTVEQAYATLAPQPQEVEEEGEEDSEDSETEQAAPAPPPEADVPEEESPVEDASAPQPDDRAKTDPEAESTEADAPADDETPSTEDEEEEPPATEPRFETPAPPSFPERARAPEGRRLRPVAVEADDEPAVSRAAPPTVLEATPAAEPSYLEDPEERQRYRIRAMATAAVVVLLLIVFFWSFDQTVEALGSMWDEFTGMLEL